MKELCLVATVDDGYQEYIPLFVYFALYAYPRYEVIIYLDGALHPEVAGCLRSIRDMGNFDVRPLSYRYDTGDPQSFKSLRWVLYDDDFAAYDNLYIGDVDVLIAREEPSLCARRVAHSESDRTAVQQPRAAGHGEAGRDRTRRAHARVLSRACCRVMQRYRGRVAAGTLRMHNEELLYRMMEESVGLPDPEASLATHHGIHLRAFHDPAQPRRSSGPAPTISSPRCSSVIVDAFRAAARSEACVEIVRRLWRIESSPARAARATPDGGPAVVRQFGNVLSLCDDLLAERAAR